MEPEHALTTSCSGGLWSGSARACDFCACSFAASWPAFGFVFFTPRAAAYEPVSVCVYKQNAMVSCHPMAVVPTSFCRLSAASAAAVLGSGLVPGGADPGTEPAEPRT